MQREAVSLAAKSGILVITGGPGTGKTTTIKTILRLFTERGKNIALQLQQEERQSAWEKRPTIPQNITSSPRVYGERRRGRRRRELYELFSNEMKRIP